MNGRIDELRASIVESKIANEDRFIDELMAETGFPEEVRRKASKRAEDLINRIRGSARLGRMDSVLAEYGLATEEGVALLRLAEALVRIPDSETKNAFIADKIVPVDWRRHLGKSTSSFVNLMTRALILARQCLAGGTGGGISSLSRQGLKWASTPFVAFGTTTAIEGLADRFIFGKTIEQALARSVKSEGNGYLYSYDMLGEAALTEADAERFFADYKNAIRAIGPSCTAPDFRDNRGVSIKLSALHPRYEQTQRDRVVKELSERVLVLSEMAKEANIGINIDAEEADRLELSLDVIEKVLRSHSLAGWDGFGIVVQAYGKAAPRVIDWLFRLAEAIDRKIMIRLVKGAYWDSEIKRAQVEGLPDFPVYTRKAATDVSYLCCAKKLLGMTDRIYPQFAGHNAHTVSSILELANGEPFEFQRIHGMGEPLHEAVLKSESIRCRIYAPVGNHRELLPYLARRMLENGANSSFVNQIADFSWQAEDIAADPFDALAKARNRNIRKISAPSDIFGLERRNSMGWDLHNPHVVSKIETVREPFRAYSWTAGVITGASTREDGETPISNPGNPSDIVGTTTQATKGEVDAALDAARTWGKASARERGRVLRKASDLYEARYDEIFSLLCREAGKATKDAVAELREAVDFLRYYSLEAEKLEGRSPLGIVVCISPWNFPLAIFTGQISGALAAGNAVIAKPANQTPLIGRLAIDCLHEAGVPRATLQLLTGSGTKVGSQLVSDPRVSGVGFTGSTETAMAINSSMADSGDPAAPLVAETGGLNVMIVDSTALPEQVVRDIIISAFQSAGQRCSALRMLYLQEDVFEFFLKMLFGAMDELRVGDPWEVATDIGPLIDQSAKTKVENYIETARSEGRLLKQCAAPDEGYFVGPAVVRVDGIGDLKEELFGPVLHVAKFRPRELDRIVDAINASGFGLTFGLHSRIDERVRDITGRLKVGNMYVNRNQIGAVVESQPFGGEGLSGTGPKAGGPRYVRRFSRGKMHAHRVPAGRDADVKRVQELLDQAKSRTEGSPVTVELPGPTGESNHMNYHPRGVVLCLGPSAEDGARQMYIARSAGCSAVVVCDGIDDESAVPGILPREALSTLGNFDIVALWSDEADLREARRALSARSGPLVPLVAMSELEDYCVHERHVCIDTTAAGGNASLFAGVS